MGRERKNLYRGHIRAEEMDGGRVGKFHRAIDSVRVEWASFTERSISTCALVTVHDRLTRQSRCPSIVRSLSTPHPVNAASPSNLLADRRT